MLSIYHFKTTKEFLSFTWEEKKKKNPSFSLRSWAKSLGFKSHNSLYQVMKGERLMPKSFLPKLRESLDLSEKEVYFLETLIDLEKAKSLPEKEMFLDRLKELSPLNQHGDFKQVKNYQFFSDPLKAAIAELALRADFRAEPDWIQNELVIKSDLNQINRAIDCLLFLGILEEDSEGRLIRKEVRLSSTNDVKSAALQEYHQKLCALASEQVKEQELDKREFHGFIFNIDPEKMDDAKTRIREFIKEFSKDFEATPGSTSETYCLQTNLFSLTKQNIKQNGELK